MVRSNRLDLTVVSLSLYATTARIRRIRHWWSCRPPCAYLNYFLQFRSLVLGIHCFYITTPMPPSFIVTKTHKVNDIKNDTHYVYNTHITIHTTFLIKLLYNHSIPYTCVSQTVIRRSLEAHVPFKKHINRFPTLYLHIKNNYHKFFLETHKT